MPNSWYFNQGTFKDTKTFKELKVLAWKTDFQVPLSFAFQSCLRSCSTHDAGCHSSMCWFVVSELGAVDSCISGLYRRIYFYLSNSLNIMRNIEIFFPSLHILHILHTAQLGHSGSLVSMDTWYQGPQNWTEQTLIELNWIFGAVNTFNSIHTLTQRKKKAQFRYLHLNSY